jgi:hypothetical protein
VVSRQQPKGRIAPRLSGLWRPGLAIAAVVALGACDRPFHLKDPSPDGPTISALELVPGRVTMGCPVTVRFHLEAPRAPVTRAFAESTRVRGRGRETRLAELAVDPAAVAGKSAGDVAVPVGFASPGKYWYSVQVEDEGGRRSNVLRGRIVVEAGGTGTPPACP